MKKQEYVNERKKCKRRKTIIKTWKSSGQQSRAKFEVGETFMKGDGRFEAPKEKSKFIEGEFPCGPFTRQLR